MNHQNPASTDHPNPHLNRAKIRLGERAYVNPVDYQHPYASMARFAQLLALRYDANRTRHAYYRQLRLIHKHCDAGPPGAAGVPLRAALPALRRPHAPDRFGKMLLAQAGAAQETSPPTDPIRRMTTALPNRPMSRARQASVAPRQKFMDRLPNGSFQGCVSLFLDRDSASDSMLMPPLTAPPDVVGPLPPATDPI